MKWLNTPIQRIQPHTQQRIAWWLLALIMLLYTLEMSHQAILRYDTFKATAFDLGNMDQVIWNTIHGRLFQFTNQAIDWYGPSTRLAIHFEPIILPLSLLYLFYADPRILLVFQTLVLMTGALPVFLLARKYLPCWPLLATLMAAAYLLSPALLGLNIFDFHPVALATPLLLYAILALEYKHYTWFLLACVLAASCKEDIPLAIAMFGIMLIWKYKLPRLGTTLLVGGILWSAIAFGIIIPHFYPGVQHNNYWYRYEELGSSPEAAIVNLLLHPWLFFTTFLTIDRFYYFASLFRSTGFLPLLAPEWLLPALPSLAVNTLSNDPLTYSGVYHYNAAIIPFVVLSAIHGIRRLILIWQQWRGEKNEQGEYDQVEVKQGRNNQGGGQPGGYNPRPYHTTVELPASYMVGARLAPALVPLALVRLAFALVRPSLVPLTLPTWRRTQWQRFNERMIPLAKKISLARLQWVMFAWITIMLGLNFLIATPQLDALWPDHEPGSREQHIQQLLTKIPLNASVSAGSNLNPHLSERRFILVFPEISDAVHTTRIVKYIIVDLNNIYTEDRAETTSRLNNLINTKQYRVLARAEGVVLLIHTNSG